MDHQIPEPCAADCISQLSEDPCDACVVRYSYWADIDFSDEPDNPFEIGNYET